MNTDFETLQAPPSGLCSCRLNGKYVHIAALSPRSVTLRLYREETPGGALALQLYRADTGRHEQHIIENYTAGKAQHQNGAVLLRLCFDDPDCARAIRAALNSYARCLETKAEEGASAWAQQTSGYPAALDGDFLPSLQAQRAAWFAAYPPLPAAPEGCEIAVALNCPELWEMYLRLPPAEFMRAYAAARQLPPDTFAALHPRRLYVGSPFCRFLFPDEEELTCIAEKARHEGLALTLVTAELRAGGEAEADRRISSARALDAELEINDWGMLRRAAGQAKLTLGVRLNRRRKDPRMRYKAHLQPELLGENSLNDPAWRDFLRSLGVIRCEYESCGLPTRLPDALPCSLHLPFYHTNTALWCPLEAICRSGDRGAQRPQEACSRPCNENVLLYPAHLRMLGRWNSLLALSDLPQLQELERYDRWVLNF